MGHSHKDKNEHHQNTLLFSAVFILLSTSVYIPGELWSLPHKNDTTQMEKVQKELMTKRLGKLPYEDRKTKKKHRLRRDMVEIH